ncbi:MAG: 4a-hydroxytetrahydrobiopterin dehydratase [Candidatus Doudnabacteria bacterium]|nr:4a-hydroxytetrahydrobiopterin dehydratase [Candidatus Doudnabacteria bacterium]
MDPISLDRAQEYLKQLHPDWKIVENGKKIRREFKFKNFQSALDFVNKIGEIAESEGHHPDIQFGWGYAIITLWTHAINGLFENDFILAAKIDRLNN